MKPIGFREKETLKKILYKYYINEAWKKTQSIGDFSPRPY